MMQMRFSVGVMKDFHSLGVPDDGISLHELLTALKHSHVMFSQHDLHGIGTKKGDLID